MASDSEEQGAYILGVDEPVREFTGQVTAFIHCGDDVEDKWVITPADMSFSREDIQAATYLQEQYFDAQVIFALPYVPAVQKICDCIFVLLRV